MLHFSENIRLDADAKIALRAVKDPPLGVHSLMVHRLTVGHQVRKNTLLWCFPVCPYLGEISDWLTDWGRIAENRCVRFLSQTENCTMRHDKLCLFCLAFMSFEGIMWFLLYLGNRKQTLELRPHEEMCLCLCLIGNIFTAGVVIMMMMYVL